MASLSEIKLRLGCNICRNFAQGSGEGREGEGRGSEAEADTGGQREGPATANHQRQTISREET